MTVRLATPVAAMTMSFSVFPSQTETKNFQNGIFTAPAIVPATSKIGIGHGREHEHDHGAVPVHPLLHRPVEGALADDGAAAVAGRISRELAQRLPHARDKPDENRRRDAQDRMQDGAAAEYRRYARRRQEDGGGADDADREDADVAVRPQLGEVDVEVEESEGKRRDEKTGGDEEGVIDPPEKASLLSDENKRWLTEGRLVWGLRHPLP